MMNKWSCTVYFLILFSCAFGQDGKTSYEKTDKLFYTELGGPGILFSANLDSRFKPSSRLGWGIRGGVGFTLVEDDNASSNYTTRSVITIPVGVNYLFGKSGSAHMFEVGAGVTVLSRSSSILNYNDYKEGHFMGHFEFMYRRQSADGGFSWRIGFTPLINPDGDIVPFGAVGFGFSFK